MPPSRFRLTSFANPNKFFRLVRPVRPVLGLLAVMLFGWGLWLGLWQSPSDYKQGEYVRIMYVHVPSAWISLFVYTSMAVSAFFGFVFRHRLASLYVKAAAPIGGMFTFMCLVTGALWGKPTWGTYWVWDARITSMFVLLLLYLGYLVLIHAFEDEAGDSHLQKGNLLVMVGVINLPIIKYSVDWWNTLHQPASITLTKAPSIAPEMLWPLLVMTLAFFCFFGWAVTLALETELLRAKTHKTG